MSENVLVYTSEAPASADWKDFHAFGKPAGQAIQIDTGLNHSEAIVEGLSFWRHQGGALRYCIPHQEIFVLLEGKAEITNSAGAKYYVNTHEVGIVPAGFEGTWKTIEPLIKVSAKLIPR